MMTVKRLLRLLAAASVVAFAAPTTPASAEPSPMLAQASMTVQEDPIDPEVCPVLITIHDATGGTIAVIEIREDGDIAIEVADEYFPLWDCPPFEEE
jgi:hypothetical protein